jgi:hypothetical protein
MADYNEGVKTFACVSGTDIAAYRLVAYRGANAVAAYNAATDTLLEGVTISASYDDEVAVKSAKFPGSILVAVEASENVTDKDLITFGGVTAGTIQTAGVGEEIIGYTRTTATSTASDLAIAEVVLFSGAQLVAASAAVET